MFKRQSVLTCNTPRHPKFLNSNSTSHSWAFGAIAELVDNAQDPDVMADQLSIDVRTIRGHTTLMVADSEK